MVQIAGKYQLVTNDKLYDYLVAQGVDAEKAKQLDSIKPILEVVHDSNKVTLTSTPGSGTINYVLNEAIDEPTAFGVTMKSTVKLNGDLLTVTSQSPDGKNGERKYQFSDAGLVVTLTAQDSKVPKATRTYKRV